MKWNRGASAVAVPKLLMRSALADFNKAEGLEPADHLAWFKDREVAHNQPTWII